MVRIQRVVQKLSSEDLINRICTAQEFCWTIAKGLFSRLQELLILLFYVSLKFEVYICWFVDNVPFS